MSGVYDDKIRHDLEFRGEVAEMGLGLELPAG